MNPEKFLNSLVNYEKIPSYDYTLKTFVRFLKRLNTPQKRIHNVIHIAGTKGKGSTAAIISSCLQSCGYRTGLFTSPHLKKVNERIKVNGVEISNQDMERYIRRIRPYIREKHGADSVKYSRFHGARTFFEVLTVIAFLHFIEKRTDFSILEAGMGGKLDTTNTTDPIVSVITRVGYDHTNLLGNKLSQIAFKKAGIIKKNGRLITVHQRPCVQRVINRSARAKKCHITFAENQHSIKKQKQSVKGSHLKIQGALGTFNTFLPLAGNHHVENLLVALSVLNEIRNMGFNIPVNAIKNGIRRTNLHARFETVSKEPLIIFDCAHNQDSFKALDENLTLFNIKDFYMIFGTNKDKDIRYCLKHIFPKAKEVLLVRAENPRAMDQHNIYKKAKKYQQDLVIASSVKDAIAYIKTKARHKPTILITGSFYLWQDDWKTG